MNVMNRVLLHLSLIDGIGPAVITHLRATGLDLNDLYSITQAELVNQFGLSSLVAQKIEQGLRDRKMLDLECELIEKHQITLVTITDSCYPSLLKEIHLPPVVLYTKGDPLGDERSIAVVGSRKADAYGASVIDSLVPPLVANGWVVVSGGALGIDSMAHRKTVEHGGRTVVIFGSGLLKPYPANNKRLFMDVLEKGGTLVSSFPLTMEPLAGNFPARNRIIAGLSKGCLVVQAAEKSGARITAQFALHQGREVFAVPGPIDSPLSVGSHHLIQQGAKLVQHAQDILQEFGETVICAAPVESGSAEGTLSDTIVKWCKEPKSIDELAALTSCEIGELYGVLFELQISGKLFQTSAGLFEQLL
jgi:DNA processing protein